MRVWNSFSERFVWLSRIVRRCVWETVEVGQENCQRSWFQHMTKVSLESRSRWAHDLGSSKMPLVSQGVALLPSRQQNRDSNTGKSWSHCWVSPPLYWVPHIPDQLYPYKIDNWNENSIAFSVFRSMCCTWGKENLFGDQYTSVSDRHVFFLS